MGAFPALIGFPAVLVAVVIGVTVSALQLAT
jgi:type III secretory pathway component EscS